MVMYQKTLLERVMRMSKKKREIERVKKQKARQIKRRAKEKRQHNDSEKWEEKKAKKRAAQQAKWDQYPNANPDCPLILSKHPTPENCRDCELFCRYNPN